VFLFLENGGDVVPEFVAVAVVLGAVLEPGLVLKDRPSFLRCVGQIALCLFQGGLQEVVSKAESLVSVCVCMISFPFGCVVCVNGPTLAVSLCSGPRRNRDQNERDTDLNCAGIRQPMMWAPKTKLQRTVFFLICSDYEKSFRAISKRANRKIILFASCDRLTMAPLGFSIAAVGSVSAVIVTTRDDPCRSVRPICRKQARAFGQK
jgi:hypothetical protein